MSMIHFPRTWESVMASALTSIRESWSVTKLELMALEGHPTPACGDTLAESRRMGHNRVMSTCTCNLPKYTPEEKEALASFTTAREVITFHRTRHSATIVRNEFADIYYPGDDTPHRGTRIQLSCGAAIGLPFDKFGR